MLLTSFSADFPPAMRSVKCWWNSEEKACPPRPPEKISDLNGLSCICLRSVPKNVCATQTRACFTRAARCALPLAVWV
jgi:hypothetical protein